MAEDAAPSNTNVTAETAAPPPAPAPEVPSAFSLFRPSWEGLKLNIVEFLIVFFLPSAIFVVLSFILALVLVSGGSRAIALGVLVGLAVLAYVAVIGPAMAYLELKSGRMEKANYKEAFACSKKFWWRFILLSLAIGLLIGIGLILLIVPGIIFIRRYFLSQFALIDQDLGVRESMRVSSELSKGRSMTVFGIIGVDILIGLPNIIPFIGGIITFVLQVAYLCAPAIRYQQLKALKPVSVAAKT